MTKIAVMLNNSAYSPFIVREVEVESETTYYVVVHGKRQKKNGRWMKYFDSRGEANSYMARNLWARSIHAAAAALREQERAKKFRAALYELAPDWDEETGAERDPTP